MPKKSHFRRPDAQHFQLVHRSQRDPLINDPDAGQHVLKSFTPANKKGKSRAELESYLDPSIVEHDRRAKVGEASLYGIYFDDTDYDYMQHLRSIGDNGDGVDAELLPTPSTSQQKFSLRDLPSETLPSRSELPRSYVYESQEAVPSSISGLQPDMDPHLRQVLEALEDDAFVDEDADDDFFGDLVKEGQRAEGEMPDFDFEEDDYYDQDTPSDDQDDDGWESRFAQFKISKSWEEAASEDDDELRTEGADTVSHLPEILVKGGKRRRKGTSDASGYSMSSASIARTEHMQTMDEKFDALMEKEYAEDDEDELEVTSDIDDEPPDLLAANPALASLVGDFLGTYEQLGRRIQPRLEGDTPIEKLDTLRRAMGKDEPEQRKWGFEGLSSDEDSSSDHTEDGKQHRWDCDTIISTYSNLENHPRLIKARRDRNVPKINLDKRGLPVVIENKPADDAEDSEDANADLSEQKLNRQTITRQRDETPEMKRARKEAAKAEQRQRRNDKRVKKEAFDRETQIAKRRLLNNEKPKLRAL